MLKEEEKISMVSPELEIKGIIDLGKGQMGKLFYEFFRRHSLLQYIKDN
jgi:hypothetical protein